MSELITLDEAIEWGKRGELCELMTEDDQRQIAEWLRQVRWADAAVRWYTAKLRELEAENAKLLERCADLYAEMITYSNAPNYNASVWAPKLRELGIEVD